MKIPFDDVPVADQARTPFRCLFDLFLERLFYNDLLSSSEDEQLTVGNILAVLSFPGLFLGLHLIPKYIFTPPDQRHLAVLNDKCLFLSLSMVILALLAVIQWDSLFPDRRDYAILNVLPVKLRTLFAAKAAALGALILIFFGLLNLASVVFFPIAAVDDGASILQGLRFALAHAASVLVASLFVVSSFVALRGALMTILPFGLFQRVSPWVQLICLFALFSVLLLLPALVGIAQPGGEGMAYAYLHPAMWFVGFSEWLEGHASPQYLALAAIALRASLLVGATALATYLLSYRLHARKSLESLEPNSAVRSAVQAMLARPIDAWLSKRPRQLAVFHFVVATMTRSVTQRLFLTAFVGLGLSLTLAKLLGLVGGGAQQQFQLTTGWLTIPLTLSFFVLVGMRVIFILPAELPANWVFQITATGHREEYLSGVRKAMLLAGIAPLAIGFLPVTVVWWGWVVAIKHLLFFIAVSWMLAEGLMFRFPKIPFTCPYMPGRANIIFLWAFYGFVFIMFSYSLADYEGSVIESPIELANFISFAAAFALALLLYRKHVLRQGAGPVFQEQSSTAYQRLNLVP